MSQQGFSLKNVHLMPLEERLETVNKSTNFTIGLPTETEYHEKRVALAPQAVKLLVSLGNRVIVERGAGDSATFLTQEYSAAGAEIVESSAEVFQADIVVKVAPPTLSEIASMKSRITLISALHLRGQNTAYFKALSEKKITAISYEHIQDNTGSNPVMQSISEITGSAAILLGAEYLNCTKWGRGLMLGGFSGISPSEVVIIGAGTVGEYAAKAALGLGAMVKIFDNSVVKLRRLQEHIGMRVFTSIIQPTVLEAALKTADLVVAAIYAPNGNSVMVVSEEMVKQMKKGSMIVDISIDRGGCFETSKETTHLEPVYQVHDVTHYCVPNISSRTPHTSTYALSNYFSPLLVDLTKAGSIIELLINDSGLQKGVYMLNGKLSMEYISKKFNLSYQNIELLLAAFR